MLNDHPNIDPDHFDAVTIATLRRAFPTAWIDVLATLITQMDNMPSDRHVLATAIAAGAPLVITANTADFHSPQFVESGQIRIDEPAVFLASTLEEHDDVIAGVLEHLAAHRRGVDTVSNVLDELARNNALQPFVNLAHTRLL